MIPSTLESLNDSLGERAIDALICCASFEERCKTIPENIALSMVKHAWIAFNRNFKTSTVKNLETIKQRFEDKHTLMEFDTSNPLLTADCIEDKLKQLSALRQPRVVVDITSFTRESLLILLKYLNERKNAWQSLEFIYIRASEYSVGEHSDNKWLSRGNQEIRSILGYPGTIVPSRKNHLVVLVGFEDERALNLIRECEPSRISLGIGEETEWAAKPHQSTNLERFRRLKSILGPVEEFTFKGYDARATKEVIKKLISNVPDYNTILVPMNTKISTIGAGMAALEDDSIQVCYAQADLYNIKNYSKPGSHFFHVSLEEISS